jgi:outer membrane protein assembly factor BamB
MLGCSNSPAGADPAAAIPAAEDTEASANVQVTAAVSKPDDDLPSLWTRKQGVDWPIFLGPTRDSKSTEKGILTDWSDGKLKVLWQDELGTSYGIGTISQGRLFQLDRYGDQVRLYCLNAETGQELWRFEYPTDYDDVVGYNNGPRCSPIVDGNRVYSFGAAGMLHCLRANDGKLIWKLDTTEKYNVVQNFFGVGSTPAIEGNLLICMIGGSPSPYEVDGELRPAPANVYAADGDVSSDRTGIVAFDKFTGKVVYETADELASYASIQLASIGNRRWGFAFCRGGLVGFEPATGKVDFHYPWRSNLLESVNASLPVVVGDEVFISETYSLGSSLLKVRPGGYDVVWKDDAQVREKAMRTHWNTPIHVDGYLYGCSGRNPPDANLRCIEWKTGKVMWEVPDRRNLEGQIRERSSLLHVDGHLVFLGELGTLRLIKVNPEKYDLVTEVVLRRAEGDRDPIDGGPPRLLKYPCWAAPILSHGLLYVRGDDRLVCVELIPEA